MADTWIAQRIDKGEVLVAEESGVRSQESGVRSQESGVRGQGVSSSVTPDSCLLTPVGYIIAQDKYHKREELGLIVQLCVDPSKQRGLVGAMLVKAAFERAAYGCRLFCLWCAQDIEANRFWESIGFVPLAFRGGSEKNKKGGRVHIFWQKRIRAGDTGAGATPWWFPSKTGAGAMRADRIVLPIPPGKHWSDEMPVIVVPQEPAAQEPAAQEPAANRLADGRKAKKPAEQSKPSLRAPRQFGPVTAKPTDPASAPTATPPAPEKKLRRNKPTATAAHPKLVAAARELRDRWLEHVNSGGALIGSVGKYDVTRSLPSASNAHSVRQRHLSATAMLPAA